MAKHAPADHGLARRDALKLFAAGVAASLSACGKSDDEIVPYVEMPERMVPGLPLRFATVLPLSGYGRGVLVTSSEGRPTKIEGNPRHPASLGATDVFAEAAVLSLYDPDRSRTVRRGAEVASWNSFEAALLAQLDREAARHGAGLRIVTGRITSPTLRRQLAALLKTYPEARWYRYEPLADDAARQGARLAFGRRVTALPRLGDADVVLTLDADPLGPGPEQLHHARSFATRRHAGGPMLRLYALEPGWSLTGANADHRLPLSTSAVHSAALMVAARLGADVPADDLPAAARRFVSAAVADLQAHSGRALVLAGPAQPPEIHALCHWINARLRAPVDVIETIDPAEDDHAASVAAFAADLGAGKVETLVLIGVNPAYDLPPALGIGDALRRVPFSVHAGLYRDETAALCRWHVPLPHPLETWTDLRAFDGTAAIAQPLIRPLYDTRSAHDVVALLQRQLDASAHALVRATWRDAATGDFEGWWRRTLHDGLVDGSAYRPIDGIAPALPRVSPAPAAAGFTVSLHPDASVWDGSFANNPWLQECPKPLTTELWGNALHIGSADAALLHLESGDIVHVRSGAATLETPVLVRDGLASGAGTLALGYGRPAAGTIGTGIGANGYALRGSPADWTVSVDVTGAKRKSGVLAVQHHFRLDGEAEDILKLVSVGDLSSLAPGALDKDPDPPTFFQTPPGDDPYAWAMVIDTALCIGCNACVIACQAENNVPVVGPGEIARGRDMHWLRIDTYDLGPPQRPQPGFQPVPCMHCEHAPCEPVCPVAASVHDGEGLNVQVYNRCVGTRFCQANCPYKVRRFNFFDYSTDQAYANLGDDTFRAQRNPDVSVRGRGVMEKCTYCVQRISRARRTAEKEDRPIRDGEVIPACAAACPTQAIVFGNRNDPQAKVSGRRHDPRHYALLGHLGTRPRTTYLARVHNPNPALAEPPA